VGAQLVGEGHAVGDEVFAGSAGAAQRDGGLAIGGERTQPSPVGAQGVGEYERVESVVLVAGRAVAPAQVLDLVRADHDDRQTGLEQRVDDRPVGTFDGDLAHLRAGQDIDQLGQAGGAVLDIVPRELASAGIEDRHGVIVTGPVQPAGDTVRRIFGQLGDQGVAGRLHVSLLAARSSGEAPLCGAEAWLPVRSLIGARRRSALSTVGTPRVTVGSRKTHHGHRCVKRLWR
jgi:hypothetical protein